MSRKDRSSKKISTAPYNEFGSNPFSSLDGSGLPEALPEPKHEIKVSVKEEESKWGNGERLEIRREKTGRGGKTVTTIRGIPPGLGKEKKGKTFETNEKYPWHRGYLVWAGYGTARGPAGRGVGVDESNGLSSGPCGWMSLSVP